MGGVTRAGDIVDVRVTETHPYGMYGLTDLGESVFVNLAELSWARLRHASDVVSIGDVVSVNLQQSPNDRRPYFLGSLKRLSSDPWASAGIREGEAYEGTVVKVGCDFLLVRLSPHIDVAVPFQRRLMVGAEVGTAVRVVVDSVDVEGQKATARLVDDEPV